MKINFAIVLMMALCCLSYVRAYCAVSNITSTIMSPCRGNAETISFCDAYFTSLAFIDQRVKCRGILKKIQHGPLVLKPVEGELRDDEHIVHANKWKFIGIHRCKGIERCCLCNEDGTSWQGMDGKNVIVEGVLSDSSPSCSMVSEEFMSPVLLDCRISIDGGSLGTNNVVRILNPNVQHGQYVSPCHEFKLTVYLSDGGRYLIHYYSAVLWMAYINSDRLAYITRPFPLYPRVRNKVKIRKVWMMLRGLGKHIFPGTNNLCPMSVNCTAERYSKIKSIEIRNPQNDLISNVKNLFDFVYEQQRRVE